MWWSQELSLGFWTTNFCIFLPVDSVVPTPWSLTADAKKKKKKEKGKNEQIKRIAFLEAKWYKDIVGKV